MFGIGYYYRVLSFDQSHFVCCFYLPLPTQSDRLERNSGDHLPNPLLKHVPYSRFSTEINPKCDVKLKIPSTGIKL